MLGEIKGRSLFKSMVLYHCEWPGLFGFPDFFKFEWIDNIIVCVYIFLKYSLIMIIA